MFTKAKLRAWKNSLYENPYIKETFNGFGNAIEYFDRCIHRIAIGDRKILFVSKDTVTFSVREIKPDTPGAPSHCPHGIHSPLPDACAFFRFPEYPLL